MGGVVSQISGRSPVSTRPCSTRIATGPTFSSSTNCLVPAGTVPSSSSTKLVPTVGCPAKGSSRVGVKMHARAERSPGRRHHEDRLREIHLPGDLLHRHVVEAGGLREYREGIPLEGLGGEHVHDAIAVGARAGHGWSLWSEGAIS